MKLQLTKLLLLLSDSLHYNSIQWVARPTLTPIWENSIKFVKRMKFYQTKRMFIRLRVSKEKFLMYWNKTWVSIAIYFSKIAYNQKILWNLKCDQREKSPHFCPDLKKSELKQSPNKFKMCRISQELCRRIPIRREKCPILLQETTLQDHQTLL